MKEFCLNPLERNNTLRVTVKVYKKPFKKSAKYIVDFEDGKKLVLSYKEFVAWARLNRRYLSNLKRNCRYN